MDKGYIYKRRLLKLADFLDTVPEERFNFRKWVNNDWGGKADLSCGTQACALGWATTIPSFRKLGLRLIKNPIHDSIFKFVPGLKDFEYDNDRLLGPSQDACWKIFGLSSYEHDILFTEDSGLDIDDVTPKEVANNIRNFVEEKYS